MNPYLAKFVKTFINQFDLLNVARALYNSGMTGLPELENSWINIYPGVKDARKCELNSKSPLISLINLRLTLILPPKSPSSACWLVQHNARHDRAGSWPPYLARHFYILHYFVKPQ